ncbi:hypothetical protein B0H13DRAFT_1875865 [Mycena leptocephala]|nr:hypothetical protein B0H13DRAFT_1875865 [Mycena leptocephala]
MQQTFDFPYIPRSEMNANAKLEAWRRPWQTPRALKLEGLFVRSGLRFPEYFRRLGKVSTLKLLHIILTTGSWDDKIRATVKKDPRLKALVKYGTEGSEGSCEQHHIDVVATSGRTLAVGIPPKRPKKIFGMVISLKNLDELGKATGPTLEVLDERLHDDPVGACNIRVPLQFSPAASTAFFQCHGAKLLHLCAPLEILIKINVFPPVSTQPVGKQSASGKLHCPHNTLSKIPLDFNPEGIVLCITHFRRDLGKNIWISLSEVLRPMGITLTDGDGVDGAVSRTRGSGCGPGLRDPLACGAFLCEI